MRQLQGSQRHTAFWGVVPYRFDSIDRSIDSGAAHLQYQPTRRSQPLDPVPQSRAESKAPSPLYPPLQRAMLVPPSPASSWPPLAQFSSSLLRWSLGRAPGEVALDGGRTNRWAFNSLGAGVGALLLMTHAQSSIPTKHLSQTPDWTRAFPLLVGRLRFRRRGWTLVGQRDSLRPPVMMAIKRASARTHSFPPTGWLTASLPQPQPHTTHRQIRRPGGPGGSVLQIPLRRKEWALRSGDEQPPRGSG